MKRNIQTGSESSEPFCCLLIQLVCVCFTRSTRQIELIFPAAHPWCTITTTRRCLIVHGFHRAQAHTARNSLVVRTNGPAFPRETKTTWTTCRRVRAMTSERDRCATCDVIRRTFAQQKLEEEIDKHVRVGLLLDFKMLLFYFFDFYRFNP